MGGNFSDHMAKQNRWDSRKYKGRNRKSKEKSRYDLVTEEINRMFELTNRLFKLNKSIIRIKRQIKGGQDLDKKYSSMYDYGFQIVSDVKGIQNFIVTEKLSRPQTNKYYKNLVFFKNTYGYFKKLTFDIYQRRLREKEKDERVN